jgi:GNAT superfamily N-acetyltransferase
MKAATLSIRQMNRSDLDMAIDWAEVEGWNPGNHDADCFYATDPNGFFIGLLDNEPVAMVSAVAYGDSYGFMGFYIVKPEVRDKGYGVQLWDAGLRYLAGRCIGLDSVRPDLVSHKKPEFKPAYTNYRFAWIKDQQWAVNPEVVDLAEVSFSIVAAYDYKVFAFSREDFLGKWITRPGTTALGVLKDDKLSAYGVIRECREGFKIGPLFADNAEYARALFEALTKEAEMGVPIFLDTPEKNAESVMFAQSLGMTEVFRTTRMYNKSEPTLPLDKWFGVTSFELG